MRLFKRVLKNKENTHLRSLPIPSRLRQRNSKTCSSPLFVVRVLRWWQPFVVVTVVPAVVSRYMNLYHNKSTKHLPAVTSQSGSTDGDAGQTDSSRDRNKKAKAEDFLLGSLTVSVLDRVTYNNNQLEMILVMQEKDKDIQQYSWPPLQELVIPPSILRLGRATMKTAMKVATKMESSENMVKMRVSWVGLQV